MARAVRKRVGAQAGIDPLDDSETGPGETPVDPARLEDLLGYALTRADVRVRKLFRKHMEQLDLRPAEFSVLLLVDRLSPVSQRQIGATLDVSAPNMAVLLDRLEGRRLLKRVRSTDDRRFQHLYLTPQGLALLRKAQSAVGNVEREAMQPLSPRERRILLTLLGKVAGGGP